MALPDLEVVTARWRELGVTDKEAWGHANLGVSYFNLSRMDEAARELELALGLFEQIGDKVGAVAASSFLCLARPTDRRVPGWLAQALEFADQAGDRSRQLGTLTTLAWHHFIRSLWGTAGAIRPKPRDSPSDWRSWPRSSAPSTWSCTAGACSPSWRASAGDSTKPPATPRCSSAWKARSTPRATRGSGAPPPSSCPWRAARSSLAPPLAPVTSPDPVVAMALLVIEAELTVGGRIAEALARFDMVERPVLGPFGDLAGVLIGLALVLAGRPTEALPWVERAAECGAGAPGAPRHAAAAALRTEITGDPPRICPLDRRRPVEHQRGARAAGTRSARATALPSRPSGAACPRSPCRACSSGW